MCVYCMQVTDPQIWLLGKTSKQLQEKSECCWTSSKGRCFWESTVIFSVLRIFWSQDLLEVMISFPAHKTSPPWTDSGGVSLTTSSDSDHPFWHVCVFFTSQSNFPPARRPSSSFSLIGMQMWRLEQQLASRLMTTKRCWGWKYVLRTAELKDKEESRMLTVLWISVNCELPTSEFFHSREKYLSCLNQLFCVSLTEKAESSSYLL